MVLRESSFNMTRRGGGKEDFDSESNCLANFSQTISQTSYPFRQSQHKRKIRDKTRDIVYNCSDLTKVSFNRGTEASGGGGGGN